jgi:hypothetical protein
MSPTATASEARGRRKGFAPRWLVIAHRYLGIAVGGLMLLWCLSGFVMLFVHWPQVTAEERAAGLAPIAEGCCRLEGLLADDLRLEAAAVEQLGGGPVLRVHADGAGPEVFDLATGQPLRPLGEARARAAAAGDARGAAVARAALIDRDQWTVTVRDAKRPLWRLRLADPAATDLYVSARTGELVQRTTAAGRVLNWLGPIPHWLYPALLRQHPKVWSQVVIWASLAGVVLTLVGAYLGLAAWKPFRDPRLTPFRGLMAWHHLAGLVGGVLTLTWVLSGLVSMNPLGLLESPPDPVAARLAGPPPTWAETRAALTAAAHAAPGARRLELARFGARPFVLADGRRLDAAGRPAPLAAADLAAAVARLGQVQDQRLVAEGDAYYFTHHEAVRLPAWRAVMADGRRYYLDPASGALLADVDGAARGYRWLHLGLHRLDVVRGLDRGPLWAALVTLLLAATTVGVATGAWLGLRRALHDLGWKPPR